MLRRIREPFGKAGLVVAAIALIAALAGGAYAASALTGKQKKEVKKIAKRFAGKNGRAGAAGPAGPQGLPGLAGGQGPRGDTGAKGSSGTNGEKGDQGEPGEPGDDGQDGENVNVIPLSPGDPNCESGGAKLTNLTGSAFACNGKDGGGIDMTAPPGSTMKGYWEVLGDAAIHVDFGLGNWAVTTIAFPLRLETAPEAVLIPTVGATEEQKDKCPGEFENPEATAGVLCLYQALGANATLEFGGPTTFGAGLFFAPADETFGSWAVKAP